MIWTTQQKTFQIWLATPKSHRRPKTQTALAKSMSLSTETLSRWKRLDGFSQETEVYRMKYVEGHLSDLYEAFIRHAINGVAAYAKLIVEIVKDKVNVFEVIETKNEEDTKKMTETNMRERMWQIMEQGGATRHLTKDNFMTMMEISQNNTAEA